MAEIKATGIDAVLKTLTDLSDLKTIRAMSKYSIYDASGMMVEAIKAAAPVESGDLRDSIVTTPMKTEDGYTYEKLEFSGYDHNGTPNELKARAIESGHSIRKGDGATVGKHPFVRPTVRRMTKTAQFMMDKAVHEYLSKFMKKEK